MDLNKFAQLEHLTNLANRATIESDIAIKEFTEDCRQMNHKIVNLQTLKNQKTILSILSVLLKEIK